MPEKMLDGVPVVERRKYNHDTAMLRQRIMHLGMAIEKLKGRSKADEQALRTLEHRFPKEYWSVVESLKEEYGKAGRLISGPNGLKKTYTEVLAKAGYRCARCQTLGVEIDDNGKFRGTSLTIDHIHEKADDGGSGMENLQALCGPCHGLKTWLSASLRLHISIDARKAGLINRRFIASYEKRIGRKSLRHELLEELSYA